VSDTCTHLGCSLASEGSVTVGQITCACHGSIFSLSDGRVISGPAVFPLEVFHAQLSEGRIEVGRPA
jgi:Rieske Fe-S protein